MAQYILIQDAYKNLDEKQKATLVNTYVKTQNECKARRIQRIKGLIRQLYSEGFAKETDSLWDTIGTLAKSEHTDSDLE